MDRAASDLAGRPESSSGTEPSAPPPGRAIRIGVLADTHIPVKVRALPARVIAALRGVDRILHAGDLVDLSLLDELARIAPTDAVAGNNDPPEVVERLGFRKLIEIGPVRVGLVHGHRGRGRNTPDRATRAFAREPRPPAAVVFGHSHLPLLKRPGERLFPDAPPLPFLLFNPGSPTDRRQAPRRSFGFLTVEPDGHVRAELVWL